MHPGEPATQGRHLLAAGVRMSSASTGEVKWSLAVRWWWGRRGLYWASQPRQAHCRLG